MPRDSHDFGWSEYTAEKQRFLDYFLDMHTRVVQGAIRGWPSAPRFYHYIDLNAGPGIDPNGNAGSPIVFQRRARANDVSYRMWCFEQNAETYQQLARALHDDPNAQWYQDDHAVAISDILPHLSRYAFGLIYNDPTSAYPSTETLMHIAARCTRLDILMHLHATGIKRSRQNGCLLDHIDALQRHKRYWFIRNPPAWHLDRGWHRTFFLGTNWANAPELRRKDFYKLDSQEGQAIAERLNFTYAQRRQLQQPTLF